MNYDFDKVFNRKENDSVKWDFPQNEKCPVYTPSKDIIPMWIADMDFAAPTCVIDAIKERCDHPLFGYFHLPQRYFDAIINWQKSRFGVTYDIQNENITYQNSVVGGVTSFISAYTLPGESILIHSSTYNGFQNIAKSIGRNLCTSDLVKDELGVFRMNFDDMELKIKNNRISSFVFCSPHNPTGRVWEKWELEKMIDLCAKYDVKIISDEIWADFIVDETCEFIPTQSVNEVGKNITMALYAPSKTFNLAGLVGAYSIIYNSAMIGKIAKASESTYYNMPNVLSCHSLIGGYENGSNWVDELNVYIRKNQEYVVNFVNENLKGLKAYLPQSTYLLWIEIIDTEKDFSEVFEEILATGVLPSSGQTYLQDNYLRFNVACPRTLCVEAMERLLELFK